MSTGLILTAFCAFALLEGVILVFLLMRHPAINTPDPLPKKEDNRADRKKLQAQLPVLQEIDALADRLDELDCRLERVEIRSKSGRLLRPAEVSECQDQPEKCEPKGPPVSDPLKGSGDDSWLKFLGAPVTPYPFPWTTNATTYTTYTGTIPVDPNATLATYNPIYTGDTVTMQRPDGSSIEL